MPVDGMIVAQTTLLVHANTLSRHERILHATPKKVFDRTPINIESNILHMPPHELRTKD